MILCKKHVTQLEKISLMEGEIPLPAKTNPYTSTPGKRLMFAQHIKNSLLRKLNILKIQ